MPAAAVKKIAQQVLIGLEFLHDFCNLTHTNLKTENILIKLPSKYMVL